MPPFKEEHLMFIIPGSQTTRAQLGINDTYAPIHHEFKTRMFPAGEGKWEPVKVRKMNKPKPKTGDGDVTMAGTDDGPKEEDEDSEYEEDPQSEEGAVYPLKEGRIVNMPAFLALMHHIHTTLSPTLHTPILIVTLPTWTVSQIEDIVRFFFEQFKTPALSMADAALTTTWAYGVETACVVDVGFEKTDVTSVVEHMVANVGRTIALPDSGGEAMTKQLHKLLGEKGWTNDMCEQLKKSPICEILPAGVPLPLAESSEKDTSKLTVTNPAAAASTGAPSSGPSVPIPAAVQPISTNGDGEGEEDIADKVVDDEGVLDVATIVASGKTQEFLAAQERKKAAAAARKVTRDAEKAAEAAATVKKLPNSKREKVTFHYQEKKIGNSSGDSAAAPVDVDAAKSANEGVTDVAARAEGEAIKPTEESIDAAPADTNAETTAPAPAPLPDNATFTQQREALRAAKREAKRKAAEGAVGPSIIRRDIEIGVERFQAVPPLMLERIADAVHRTIMSGGVEPAMRSELWDHLIITGNGAKVRGFKEALFETLRGKYLISPSSATIFTSELPSNLSTPMGTGAQTPSRDGSLPAGQHALPSFGGGSGVNPLLLAATTNSLNPSGGSLAGNMMGGGGHGQHSSHSQTPTSIRTVKMAEYFSEWKSAGDSEVVALGAQVLSRVIFITDQAASGYMTRTQYNDSGPSGIHQFGMTIV